MQHNARMIPFFIVVQFMQVAEPVEAPSKNKTALRQAQGPWLFIFSFAKIRPKCIDETLFLKKSYF